LSGFFLLAEQFLNPWESAARRGGARSDGFVGTLEVVPRERLHVGPENQVSVALPNFELVFLRRAYRAAHDLKNVCGGATVAVLHADGDADYRGSAEIAGCARGNWSDEPPVRQAPRANFDRFEQAREGAACANGIHKIALREDYRFAGSQVRGDNRERNAEIFKLARFEYTFNQIP